MILSGKFVGDALAIQFAAGVVVGWVSVIDDNDFHVFFLSLMLVLEDDIFRIYEIFFHGIY